MYFKIWTKPRKRGSAKERGMKFLRKRGSAKELLSQQKFKFLKFVPRTGIRSIERVAFSPRAE